MALSTGNTVAYKATGGAEYNTVPPNVGTSGAGGNGGDWNSDWGESNSSHYPSGYDNVVSVCPIGTNNSWNHWATYGSTIDLASPGEGIRSCTGSNSYQSWDGSSMAAPVAASVFGLLKSS